MEPSRMNILIDGFVLDRRFRNHGSYVYAKNVVASLLRLERPGLPEFRILVSPDVSSEVLELRAEGRGEFAEVPQLRSINRWRLGAGGTTMRRVGADVAFCPAPINCGLLDTPAVVTIHDVTALKAPSQTWVRNAVERAIIWSTSRFAAKILTDSENSKHDLMEAYGVPPGKIAVVYLGYDKDVFSAGPKDSIQSDNVRKRYGIERPYLLHHGVVQPRKNLGRLIQAFHLLLKRFPDLDADLVLAGPIGWRSEDIVAAAAHDSRVILTGAVAQEELVALIRSASLCVIPSLYEGFCLPLLECMACGIPTIAARSSCLPEISGGRLRYFDPLSIEEMTMAIYDGLCNEELRGRLAAQGRHRAAQFSWDRCAEETLDVLTEVAVASNRDASATVVDSVTV